MNRAKKSVGRAAMMVLALAVMGAGGVVLAQNDTGAAAPATDNKAAAITAFNQAKDLFAQNKYADAMRYNDEALKLDPDNKNAVLLKKILQNKIAEGGGGTSGGGTTGTPGKVRLLTKDQVSQIRLQEFGPEEKVEGSIDHAVLDDFWNQVLKKQPGVDMQLGAYGQFMDPGNFAGQLAKFKESNNQAFLSKVKVTSDPADMIAFKKTEHTFVLQNCATAQCHGGGDAGNFRLALPTGGVPDQLLYTNFYIMAMYETKDGGRMINRDDPASSLFLQYALPKEMAKFTHPGNVTVHRFGSPNDVQYKQMAEWVHSLALPQPNYGVVYEVPGAATQSAAPATAPK